MSAILKKEEKVNIRQLPLEHYLGRMNKNKYFSFTRYGDGEWKALWNTGGMGGHAQHLSPELRADMRRSMKERSPSGVYFGMQRMIWASRHDQIERFLINQDLQSIQWVNGDVFHRASRDGILYPLIKILRQRKMVVIGPDFLMDLKKYIPHERFIIVHSGNGYMGQMAVMKGVSEANKELGDDVIYSFSTGPSAEIYILDLQKLIPSNFLIDFGSLWDVFCGHRSRRYMKREQYPPEKLMRNLGK